MDLSFPIARHTTIVRCRAFIVQAAYNNDLDPLTTYHQNELQVALDPSSPMHSVPDVGGAQAILDVGCGAGQTLMALKATGGALKVGVDISIPAVRLGLGLDHDLHLTAASGESLPFRDGAFDFVFSRVALPYMDIPVALRELRRVLTSGGRLWAALHTVDIPAEAFWRGNWKGKVFATYVVCNGLAFHILGRTFRFPGGKCESWQNERGMRMALSQAGFRDISFNRNDRHFIVSAVAD